MSASKRSIGSDLARVDAHVIRPAEYDEVPELDDGFFDKANYEVGGRPAPNPLRKPGRPKSPRLKVHTGLRLDADVLEHFKASGSGWQTRINMALRDAMKRKG
jgi:uncharacterized protein (DUF4415 family)